MIDLHLHTKYSDGEKTVLELIDILNKKNILIAAITDHNSIDAHLEYEKNGYDKIYRGIMHKGVELQVLINDQVVEFLVYDFDLDKFQNYVKYTKEKFWNFHNFAYQKLLKIARQMNLKYIEPKKDLCNGYYANMKFQEAIRACYDENIKIIDDKIMSDIVYFYRHEFLNPQSPFYIDNKDTFPLAEEVIETAHNCDGKVFLAHIDEYKAIDDKDSFLTYLINNYNIDGIECFHPTINDENKEKYLKFARDNNLLISAGSDYHASKTINRDFINTLATKEEIIWV